MTRILLALLVLLCTACVQLGSDPVPMRYYLLEPTLQSATDYSGNTFNLSIEPIEIPAYLDRPQLVVKNRGNMIAFDDSERWAEPVQNGMSRVIRDNLVRIFPASEISIAPWEARPKEAISLVATVNAFTAAPHGETDIGIYWSLVSRGAVIKQGHFTDRQPVGESYRDMVSGLNKGLERFSRMLAEELKND